MEQIVINIIDTHNDFSTVEKFTEKGAPVLSYSSGESRFGTIMSSKLTFNMLNETAEDGKFLDLLTGEERRFLIEIRDVNDGIVNNIIWQGYLLPDVYSEPYENGSFFVHFTATDGLDVLKTKPFLFYKTRSVFDYIAKCLFETGLGYDIYFAPGVENVFYDWKNIQIFEECFTKFNENTDTYQYSSCYDVLDKLLRAVGATLYQHKGKWFIEGFNNKAQSYVKFKVYDCYGSYKNSVNVLKELKYPMFNSGVNVSLASPYKTVQLNVSYEESEKAIDFSKYVKDEEMSPEDYNTNLINQTIASLAPYNYWKSNAAAKVWSRPFDGGTYLKLQVEGNNTLHDPEEVPFFYSKSPYCVTMQKVFGPPHNFDNDYIELKGDHTIYISPQVEGKELTMDIDFELRILSRVDEQRYKDDFYRQAFRIDVLLGDDVIFSTRAETQNYESSDTKITLEKGSVGPMYYWYVFPDYTKPVYTFERFSIPNALKAEVVKKGLKTDKFGKLNVRVYIPRNGDDTFAIGANDYHVYEVTVAQLDLKVKAWDSEQAQVSREIRYTTKYESELSFGDGKNDLYQNLFKINDRADYNSYFQEINMFQGVYNQDSLYYYFLVPGNIGDYVNSRYDSLRLYSGAKWHFAHLIFGKLSKESGIEYLNGQIRISKARIDEFPLLRDFLTNITKITVGQMKVTNWFNNDTDVPRERYIFWKRTGSQDQLRYLNSYAKMIHECAAMQRVTLEGTALDVILPTNLVQFNFQENKLFIPTNISIDFSNGKTRLTLDEAVLQEVNDYSNE